MMNIFASVAFWKFLAAHQVMATAVCITIAGWAFSAYASTVVEPIPGSSRKAFFWFRFVHMAAANLDKLRGR